MYSFFLITGAPLLVFTQGDYFSFASESFFSPVTKIVVQNFYILFAILSQLFDEWRNTIFFQGLWNTNPTAPSNSESGILFQSKSGAISNLVTFVSSFGDS